MNNSKVWVVLGAGNGLGLAAVKYLVTQNQFVVALTHPNSISLPLFNDPPGHLRVIIDDKENLTKVRTTLADKLLEFGEIDFIINNSNYQLFDRSEHKTCSIIEADIKSSINAAIELISILLPNLHKNGNIINIPPQLCLASIPEKVDADKLAWGMDKFLKEMRHKLAIFNPRLTFLQPGERLADLTF